MLFLILIIGFIKTNFGLYSDNLGKCQINELLNINNKFVLRMFALIKNPTVSLNTLIID